MRHITPSHPELRRLLDRASRHTYPRGKTILRPFEPPEACYLVETGLVKVYSIDQQGEEEVRILYGKDELFPLPWLIGQPTFNTFYQALTDCVILRIPLHDFLASLRADPELSFAVLTQVIEQFAVYSARIDNLEYKYARERLAYRLLALAERFGEPSGDSSGDIVLPHLSQQEIGAMINMARESVNRELSRFERLGFITHCAGCIVITNRDGLRKEIGDPNDKLYFDP